MIGRVLEISIFLMCMKVKLIGVNNYFYKLNYQVGCYGQKKGRKNLFIMS